METSENSSATGNHSEIVTLPTSNQVTQDKPSELNNDIKPKSPTEPLSNLVTISDKPTNDEEIYYVELQPMINVPSEFLDEALASADTTKVDQLASIEHPPVEDQKQEEEPAQVEPVEEPPKKVEDNVVITNAPELSDTKSIEETVTQDSCLLNKIIEDAIELSVDQKFAPTTEVQKQTIEREIQDIQREIKLDIDVSDVEAKEAEPVIEDETQVTQESKEETTHDLEESKPDEETPNETLIDHKYEPTAEKEEVKNTEETETLVEEISLTRDDNLITTECITEDTANEGPEKINYLEDTRETQEEVKPPRNVRKRKSTIPVPETEAPAATRRSSRKPKVCEPDETDSQVNIKKQPSDTPADADKSHEDEKQDDSQPPVPEVADNKTTDEPTSAAKKSSVEKIKESEKPKEKELTEDCEAGTSNQAKIPGRTLRTRGVKRPAEPEEVPVPPQPKTELRAIKLPKLPPVARCKTDLPAQKEVERGKESKSRSRNTIASSAPSKSMESFSYPEDKKYRCTECLFKTDRLNVITWHQTKYCQIIAKKFEADVDQWKKTLQSPKGNKKRSSR